MNTLLHPLRISSTLAVVVTVAAREEGHMTRARGSHDTQVKSHDVRTRMEDHMMHKEDHMTHKEDHMMAT